MNIPAPNAAPTFVYVATIHRMAIRLFGREGSFAQGPGDADLDVDRDRVRSVDKLFAMADRHG